MLSINFGAINYWAVLVAAVATFLLGAVWYTVLFGSQRRQLLGYTEEQLKQMEQAAPPDIHRSLSLLRNRGVCDGYSVFGSGGGVGGAGSAVGFSALAGTCRRHRVDRQHHHQDSVGRVPHRRRLSACFPWNDWSHRRSLA